MSNIVIVGNGIAGITTAIELRRLDKRVHISVISDEHAYHYSRPALMYIYMGDMKLKHTQPYEKYFWREEKINLIHDHVISFDFENKRLFLKKKDSIDYDKLVLAVGAVGNRLSCLGRDLPGVLTFTDLKELKELERRTLPIGKKKKDEHFRAVIVGGGLIGIEMAEMMRHRNIDTTFLVRETSYWSTALSFEEGKMIEEEILEQNIDLKMKTELEAIHPNTNGEAGSITTRQGKRVNCNIVLLTIGVTPNIRQFRSTSLKLGKGIHVNRKFETNIGDVYACGDCAEISARLKNEQSRVESLWYTGKMHGKVVAENLLGGDREYDRGILYNSAKFFRIDYHAYGQINQNVAGKEEIYYRVPDQRKSIRIVYLPGRASTKVVGFSTLGIRFKDRVCRQWIQEERSLEYVLDHLHEANFDPEFFEHFDKKVKLWVQQRKAS